MSAVAARRQSARLRVGDTVTGWSYVEPGDRGREQPQPITGTIAQIGSGWGGVDSDHAYVWVRLPSCLEAKALTRDLEKTTTTDRPARADSAEHLPLRV
ncbi:hypothetical protein OG906_00395 [Streptomyces sp. NBC_01426]|uniref:hypothetical protein n=1 Tax=Streptomyces sp. NBC_01426 TaxID=2975866 RepID=UPI002E2F45A9|nr:hypothetical protein [Streptomyces sp. NBC_01426]